jgi:four helix bundle protein
MDRTHHAYGAFDFQRLDVHHVLQEALVAGDRLARTLPRGYANLTDQIARALLSAHLLFVEAASRTGADSRNRFRMSKAEASEAAAALQDAVLLGLLPDTEVAKVVALLARACAMLTRLAGR